MIKWNEEYEVYVSDDGHVYNKKMKEYKLQPYKSGYLRLRKHLAGKQIDKLVHRVVYETFVGEIPNGFEIDHINRINTDNRLCNLRCVDRFENIRNRDDVVTDFGLKYRKHYGYSKKENPAQYNREFKWFKKHSKCRWE